MASSPIASTIDKYSAAICVVRAPQPRPLHLLYAPDRQMTPKLRSFVDFCVAAFGAG